MRGIKKAAVLFIGICVASFTPFDAALAWSSKSSSASNVVNRPLSRYQRHKIVNRTVSHFLHDPNFVKEEVAIKTVLARMQITDSTLSVTHNELTDDVLNALINSTKLMVLNLELKTDLSLTFKLTHYLPDLETRKKGILLGSDYYISGSLGSKIVINNKGKEQKRLTTTLKLADIRTNRTIVDIQLEHELGKVKHRR